jgi:hypothetical protein
MMTEEQLPYMPDHDISLKAKHSRFSFTPRLFIASQTWLIN